MLKDKKPFWKSKTIGAIGALVVTDLVTSPPQNKQQLVTTGIKISLGILASVFRKTANTNL